MSNPVFCIKSTDNIVLHNAIVEHAKDLGYKTDYLKMGYEFFVFYDTKEAYSFRGSLENIFENHVVSLEYFFNIKAPTRVVLNEKYTAEITPEGIKVGCQTFSFETLKELYNAVKVFK